MAGFSTRSEEVIERKVDVILSPVSLSEEQLVDTYDLNICVQWILSNNLEKVQVVLMIEFFVTLRSIRKSYE